MDKCSYVISRGNVIDTIYFDFPKAFDTVPHLRLVEKMRCYGFDWTIGTWIKAFITNRSQDVAKLMASVRCFQDTLSMQNDIDELEKWPEKWLVKFHPDKCHILTLSKFQNIKYAHRYMLNGHKLDHVEEEKDLGKKFDSELTFEKHFADKIKKANQMGGIIRLSLIHI